MKKKNPEYVQKTIIPNYYLVDSNLPETIYQEKSQYGE